MNSLVSVVVVTYNSSRFVIETLDSIAKQSWIEVELIITDDCSKDDTIAVCKSWIKDNESRFKRCILVESEVNTGVSANANRGLKEATGEWLCIPAGDDTLKKDCIKDNIEQVSSNPDIKVLFSLIDLYEETFEEKNFLKRIPNDPFIPTSIVAPERSAESQYRMLLITDRVHYTPSLFIHKETILSVGGFDERFKLLEDYPLWLNLTSNGHKLNFMDKATVNYRKHSQAINNNNKGDLINPNYFKQETFRKIYTYPNLPTDVKLNQQFTWLVSQLFRNKVMKVNNNLNGILYYILTKILNPFYYFIKIKKIVNKEIENSEFYME